jgi:hypothetical protein
MAQTLATDPFTSSFGLAPRYWRERQLASLALAGATAAPSVRASDAPDLLAALRPVDAATADLRRRLSDAGWRPRRAPLAVAVPAFAGVSLALGVLLGN